MLVPKLRFKREDGTDYPEWETDIVGNRVTIYDKKVAADCTLPILTSSKTNGIEYQSDHFGREQNHDIDGYNVLPRGYATYRNRSDNRDFTFNINNICDEGIISKFYPVFTSYNCDLIFLIYLLNNSPSIVKEIGYTAIGTGQKVLSISDFKSIKVFIPDIKEQQKIADFLSTVDEVIAQSEAEVQNLEQQKKAAMQKIFSQEVRFKREDGTDYPEWEILSLGNVASVKVGEKPTKVSETPSLYEYINAGTTNSGYTNSYNCEGDTVTTPSRGQGGIGFVGYQNKPFWLGSLCYKIQSCNKNVTTKYIYFVLTQHSSAITDLKKVGSIPAINKDDLIQITLPFPCLEEQQKIADFLSAYDEAISYAKQELDKWKELKKGLLQQMFV